MEWSCLRSSPAPPVRVRGRGRSLEKAFQVQRWEMVIDAPLRASCLHCFWVLPADVSCHLSYNIVDDGDGDGWRAKKLVLLRWESRSC